MLCAIPSLRQSSAMLVSPRNPSRTTRILSSAEYCRRVARRMSRTVFSALSVLTAPAPLSPPSLCPLDPDLLPYAISSFCPVGPDGEQGAWLRLPGRCARLVQSAGSVVARVDHHGGAAFCVETLEEALAKHGKPEIFNTDQGSQFTGSAFTGLLASHGIAISMDGKGAWRDNVFVERLWRSVKYEEVYLRAYESIGEARNSIGRYLDFYNGRRPHQSLDAATPDQAYFNQSSFRLAA